ncbi:lanthionine synthetase LanC family protein [Bradyrhizobium sp. Y36]|uniref:lanthionine synthetase LanC family protein n=1 Tax=Bradyrhizobium sp. Y36 TaxID=2035447 RepID=UPI00130408C5|nr:lanthionine synthetase LanC family protein [Bradyrhizobium sp. Y36]
MMEQPHSALPGRADVAAKVRFLTVADTIGRTLVRDAIWHEDRCNWLIWTKEPVGGAFSSVYRAAGVDFYQGVGGIALFLAQLVAFTGDRYQRETLGGAVRQVMARLREPMQDRIGLYSGMLGAAKAVISSGEIADESEWIDFGLEQLETISRSSPEPSQIDLLSGCAGAIVALVEIAQRYGRQNLLQEAHRLAEFLLSRAQHARDTVSWPTNIGEGRNLLGLSHGTAGIALALLELNAVSPDKRYLDAARGALRYERQHFNALQNNWPDYRALHGAPHDATSFPIAWCHGSTGIGLSRLRIRQLLPDDPQILPELDVAIANAIRAINAPIHPLSTDFSLCHGVTGSGDFLLLVGMLFGRADGVMAAERLGDAGIEAFDKPRLPWICGVPDAGQTSSLMIGTAGIGHFYLRLYDPVAVPSILLPIGAKGSVDLSASKPDAPVRPSAN